MHVGRLLAIATGLIGVVLGCRAGLELATRVTYPDVMRPFGPGVIACSLLGLLGTGLSVARPRWSAWLLTLAAGGVLLSVLAAWISFIEARYHLLDGSVGYALQFRLIITESTLAAAGPSSLAFLVAAVLVRIGRARARAGSSPMH